MEWSRRALELYPDDMSALLSAACLHFKRGQKDQGLDLLERVFARGWGKRDWMEHDPDYDSLRDDPRFKALASLGSNSHRRLRGLPAGFVANPPSLQVGITRLRHRDATETVSRLCAHPGSDRAGILSKVDAET